MAKVSTTRRTLHYYWLATKKHFGLFALVIGSTIGFSGFLTYGNPYIMSKIVDRVSAGAVPADQVFEVFGPFVIAMILINLLGQTCSKLQDFALWRLEIAVNYDLAPWPSTRCPTNR